MPHFLDLFLDELRRKQENFKRTLTGEEKTQWDRFLRDAFQREWRDLPPPQKEQLRVIAVDSGRANREYSPGTYMYINRAAAVTSWDKTYREVVSNSHIITSPRERLRDLVSLRSEHLEHEIALQALKDNSDVDVLLLDGSLYGRTLHVPVAFNYPGERDLYLYFIETLNQLLETCRKRKVLLLGVSKDSVASHLTRLLLNPIKDQLYMSLESSLTQEQRAQLLQYLDEPQKNALSFIRLTIDLPLTQEQRDTLRHLINEYQRPRPDFALIFAWAKTKGYTTPIEPYPDVPFYKYEAKDPASYVRRRFAEAFLDHPEEAEKHEKWAIEVMQNAFHFPTFVTFCTKLAHNDTPLRVDIPAFNAGLPTRVSEISGSRFLDPPPQRIQEVLQLLQAGYGGLDLYNVWLVRADQEARLPVADVTTLYEPLIEKELKIPLVPTRRNRRGKIFQ